MIAVAELLNKDRLPGNYFAPDAYVQGDFELGLLENRQGNRLIALPDTLLQALYSSLREEVGPSAGLVMFQCGHWWGKYFYRRFAEELSTYYDKPLAEMEMVEFLQCLKQCWKTYGWGNLNLEFKHYAQGFIIATVENSAFAAVQQSDESPAERPTCHAEAGLLSTFFSQLTGQELHCVQTTCESMGAPENTFILGLEERLKVAETGIEEQQDHDTIMMRLGLDQAEISEPASEPSPESLMPEASMESIETPAEMPDAAAESLMSGPEDSVEMAEADIVPSSMAEAEAPTEIAAIEEPVIAAAESFMPEPETAIEMTETPAPTEPAATTEEPPTLDSAEALDMLADLPDLDSLDFSAETSEEIADTAAPAEAEQPDAVTEEATNISAPEMTEEPQEMSEEITDTAAPVELEQLGSIAEETSDTSMPEIVAESQDESQESDLSLDSLEALGNLAELADLEHLAGLDEQENPGA
ncbi:MAG: V4R domain-containing protein [Cyanobacteria bacterium P01_A01_bin.17]